MQPFDPLTPPNSLEDHLVVEVLSVAVLEVVSAVAWEVGGLWSLSNWEVTVTVAVAVAVAVAVVVVATVLNTTSWDDRAWIL